MNICLVSKEYPPETGWGGIGTYTYNLAHGFSELGHKVHVIAYAPDKETEYMDKEVHIHRIKHREIKRLWRLERYFPVSKILYSVRVAQKINELIKKYKIEIIEAPEWGAETFWHAFRKRVPFIIKFHTPAFLNARLNSQPLTFRTRVICWLEKVTSLKADLLTSPSRSIAKIVADTYKINIDKIKVIPNPIDKDIFKLPDREEVNGLCILYVGRLEYRKGVHILAEAIPKVVSENPKAKFLFIGKDTDTSPEGSSMKEYILKRCNNNNLSFIEHMNRFDLVRYYQKSNICVIPSIWENFPYTCLEAMACGRAVVTADSGGFNEIIDQRINGILFPCKDSDSLAKIINELIADEKLRKRIQENARKKIENCFSKEALIDKYVELYKSIITR